MNKHTVENYKMLTRVAEFATNNVGLFPKSSAALETQKALAAGIRELDELTSVRITAETEMRSGQKDRDSFRDVLKGLLAQAGRTARALNSEAIRSQKSHSDHALITSGRAFAADIAPMKKDFLVLGISPEDVAIAVSELERAIRDYSAGKGKRAAALREFDEKLETAMGDMRRFEALVENLLSKNSSAMEKWKVARTIGRVTARKRAVPSTEPAIPTTPPIAA